MALSQPVSSYFDQLIYAIGNYHYNWHPELELLMPLKGNVIVNVDGYQYQLAPADLIIINTNQGHATLATQPNTLAIRTQVAPQLCQDQGVKLSTGKFDLNSVAIPHHPAYAPLRQNIAKLYFATGSLERNTACFRLADLLYENFFVPTDQGQVPQHSNAHFAQVAKDIQESYEENLNLAGLAKRYGYSKPYFSKLFKQHFGIGFYEYLTRERLQHALSELNRGQTKISTVALDNGFTEVKSFNLAFKKHFGITPSAYQAKFLPQVTAVDAHFQQEISAAQLATAQTYLKELRAPVTPPVVDPTNCQDCHYRVDGQRYQELRQKLRKLLNDNN